MRGNSTLRGRLALVAAVTTAIWVSVLTAGFNLVLSSQLHAQAGSLLRQRAAAAAATIALAPDGSVRINEPHDDEALDTDLWIYAGGRALERPRTSGRLQRSVDELMRSGDSYAQTGEPGAVRLYRLPVLLSGGRSATVVTALPLDPYRNVAQLALVGSIGLAVLLLAAVYAVTRLLVARALAPVQEMSAQAARWSEAEPDHRFGAAHRPAELAVLAANLDGVLDRLAALLRHEQQVTEELSHELRTPLSVITAEAELLVRAGRNSADARAAAEHIVDGANRMSQILETLLTAARSRSPDSRGRCLVGPVIAAAIEAVPGASALTVRTGPDRIAAAVDADLVERIMTPLLDNAVRYAVSRIDVVVAADGPYVTIAVSDDGPGVDPAIGDAVFEPGRRDPVRSPKGAGLGLALARRLARAAGGDLTLVAGTFQVRLPGQETGPFRSGSSGDDRLAD